MQSMRTKPYPSEVQDRFIVRMPDGMRDSLKRLAKQSRRSMNAEIIARLGESLDNNYQTESRGLVLVAEEGGDDYLDPVLVSLIRRLSTEKKKALFDLLK